MTIFKTLLGVVALFLMLSLIIASIALLISIFMLFISDVFLPAYKELKRRIRI